MTESPDKQWLKRVDWAVCREPYRTELNTIASHWIEGTISNGDLALELWDIWSKIKFVEAPTATLAGIPLTDVHSQLNILVEAMQSAALNSEISSEDRREVLENLRRRSGNDSGQHR